MTAQTTTETFTNFFTGEPREGYGDEVLLETAPSEQAGIEDEGPEDYRRSDGRPD